MAKQSINIGSVPNDGTGSTLRDGGDPINDNFNEIYSAIGDGTTLTAGTFLTTTNTVSITNKTFDTTNTFPTITIGDDTSTNFTLSLGGSFEIVGGSGINTAIDNNRIVLSTDGSIVTETSSDTLTNKNLTDASNSFPTLSIGGLTFNLGDTDATPAFDLTDATNYPTSSLTGTITNAQLTGSIENSKLINSSIRIGDDTSTNFNVDLGGSFEIVGLTGISTAINNNRIELTVGSVPNASLTNSSITLGSDTINLGDTTTTITGLSVDGTGTIDLTGSGSKARFNFAGFGSLPTAATYEGMFAYDTTGQVPYVADAGGWTRLQTENDSISVHSDVNLTGIADTYILKWSSAQARFNAVADTGGATDLTISDDSSTQGTISLASDVLGFVGTNGITTTINPQNKTIESKLSSDFYSNNYLNSAALIDVTNSGTSAYLFNSHYTGNNTILYFKSGHTYAFNLDVSGHPFHLQTVSGAYSAGNPYTTGLTHVATDGTITTGASALLKVSGTLYVEVPSGSSTTIYYACQYHSGMAGSIVVQDDTSVG